MATFSFTAILTFTDFLGRERECPCSVTYGFDGRGKPKLFKAVAHSDLWAADEALDACVDDWIADKCDAEYADWLADQDEAVAA